MIYELGSLGRCLFMRGVNAGEVIETDKDSNGVSVVEEFFAVTKSATSEPAVEKAHGEIEALGATNIDCVQVRVADARSTFDPFANMPVELAA